MLNIKVKKYFLMLFSLILKAIKEKLKALRLLCYFNKLKGKLLYLKEKERSKKILHFSTFKQVKLEKIAIAL